MRSHEAGPLERFREAVLMALPSGEVTAKLPEFPAKGDFDVDQVIDSAYFFC